MKAYLENSCVSAWANEETENQFECVEQLLRLWEERKIDLVTSKVTHEEIGKIDFDKVPERIKLRFENVPARMKQMPYVEHQKLDGFNEFRTPNSFICSPRHEETTLFKKLFRVIKLSENDARHVYQAIEEKCDVFVTVDRHSILNKKSMIEAESSIRLMLPCEVVKKVTEAP